MGTSDVPLNSKVISNLEEWFEMINNVSRVSILQYGLIHTLNVSIATSIILYEYLKQ